MIFHFSHAEKVLIQKGLVLIVLECLNWSGQPVYSYLVCQAADIQQLQQQVNKQGVIDYRKYGTPILSGKGKPTELTSEQAMKLAKEKFSS